MLVVEAAVLVVARVLLARIAAAAEHERIVEERNVVARRELRALVEGRRAREARECLRRAARRDEEVRGERRRERARPPDLGSARAIREGGLSPGGRDAGAATCAMTMLYATMAPRPWP